MANLSTGLTPESAAAPPVARTRGRKLAHELVEGIGGQIRTQALRPGDKLPTEAGIMQTYGVSRTVVREALSRLQAGGLVETRHGVGTFVLLQTPAAPGFDIEGMDVSAAVDVLKVLELRISLETESAGLAALRRSDEQLGEMRLALDQFAANLADPGNAVSPDFAFHLQVALATGNRYFSDIMKHFGMRIIPRTRIDSSRLAAEPQAQYLQRVNREHEEIFEAIARRDPEAARAAMRIHLTNSRERLRKVRVVR